MKIPEILLLASHANFFDEMFQTIEARTDSFMGLNVYRWEVNPELVFLFYTGHLDKKIPERFISHVHPHLTGVLVLADENFQDQMSSGQSMMNLFEEEKNNLPVLIAVKTNRERYESLSTEVKESGLMLSEHSKMYFWTSEVKSSKSRIWKTLCTELIPSEK